MVKGLGKYIKVAQEVIARCASLPNEKPKPGLYKINTYTKLTQVDSIWSFHPIAGTSVIKRNKFILYVF